MKQPGIRILLATVALMLLVAPAWAEIEFFGTAKVKPTVYTDFDFQSSEHDAPIGNEGGLTDGEHIRGEFRLGWKAKGDKWSVKMIAEADVLYEKDTADRSFYKFAEKEDQPNSGGEFGIERVELLYTFLPQLELETGWDVRALDIKTGGLLFGDDHPFIGFRGKLSQQTSYEALYITVQNRQPISTAPSPEWGSSTEDDWRVYTLKLVQDLGGESTALPQNAFFGNADAERDTLKFSVSPIYAYSDNDSKHAQIHYYGLEITGQAGWFKPYFEVVAADGEFDDGKDISSWAMFAGLEMTINKAFNPYVAFRYTQGDDDDTDNDVDGWVGVGDIAMYSGLIGMDGNVLGSDMRQSYGATLYSYTPGGATTGNRYGGNGNGSSGDNPGQKLIAVGTRGDLSALVPKLMYKTQAFFIWYDETDNLGADVDDYAGTTFDLQLLYAISKNFSIDYLFSTFIPGDGIEDQYGDDTAFVNTLTLAWSY
ncbi:hypothetical protein A7E78_09135 [Syntrophotalea acetylenivorans]|uniref:Alginate export domain-containing protein n=1 Tax=Syntrophotalea acetylenivorans TaxID=1842532 RepID=A0A1L3GPW2_9BACT|nr:hypothetical protein [Syntrophotalea acetylenivorans]APG27986.1 hypothetical protein A7E78_09135 [Syntrophotalea acetylenivorans]